MNDPRARRGLFMVAAVVSIAALAGTYAIRGCSSQMFGPSIHAGFRRRRSIALTFDDGPSPGTMDLLEYLAQENVCATFFQCGANIERYPGIARAVHDAGHEIGNHTFSHPRLCPRIGWQPNFRSRQEVFDEFARTQAVLRSIGVQAKLLRAPYGLRWFGLRRVCRELGLLGVMWTVIGRDWELDAVSIAELVLSRATPGGIICLHDGRDTRIHPDISETLEAVKRIVPALREKGYTFELVSALRQPSLLSGGCEMD